MSGWERDYVLSQMEADLLGRRESFFLGWRLSLALAGMHRHGVLCRIFGCHAWENVRKTRFWFETLDRAVRECQRRDFVALKVTLAEIEQEWLRLSRTWKPWVRARFNQYLHDLITWKWALEPIAA